MHRKHKRLSLVLRTASSIAIDDHSQIIFFSDVHRGDNSFADEFASNHHIYTYALEFYLREGFTYIEVGDGDELMKNSSPRVIQQAHPEIYRILREYYLEGRFYLIHGNHDILYKDREYAAMHLSTMQSCSDCEPELLFPGITIHEGLLLEYQPGGGSILVTHGHQGELLNEGLWCLSRFLLRYLWQPLQKIGIQNPYRVAHNPDMRREVECQLMDWSKEHNQPLLSGHTHCAVLSSPRETRYFNTGCCIHPQWITGIEIDQGLIMLVRWRVEPDQQGSLIIRRKIITGPYQLADYFLPSKKTPQLEVILRDAQQESILEPAELT